MEQFKILRKVAIFFLIFAAAIHIIIYSLYFVVGELVLDDLAYSEPSWVQLGRDYPHLAYLISGYIRMKGILVVVVESIHRYKYEIRLVTLCVLFD